METRWRLARALRGRRPADEDMAQAALSGAKRAARRSPSGAVPAPPERGGRQASRHQPKKTRGRQLFAAATG